VSCVEPGAPPSPRARMADSTGQRIRCGADAFRVSKSGHIGSSIRHRDRREPYALDLGQDRVLVVTCAKGHGQFSKIGIDYRFPYVLTLREGLVIRVDRYRDRAEALKALGLPE
jgi:hypothetical protein